MKAKHHQSPHNKSESNTPQTKKAWIFASFFVLALAIITIGLPLAMQYSLRRDAQIKAQAENVICAQVETKACFLGIPYVCKNYATPCQIPAGWITE